MDKIIFKKVGIGILIIYIIIWSYLFLAIFYANHLQNSFNTAITGCYKDEDISVATQCADGLKKYQINIVWLFKPIFGR